jgi:hypothetical protein
MHARFPSQNFAKPRAASAPARRHVTLPDGGKGLEVFRAALLAPIAHSSLSDARRQGMENMGNYLMQEELRYAVLHRTTEVL